MFARLQVIFSRSVPGPRPNPHLNETGNSVYMQLKLHGNQRGTRFRIGSKKSVGPGVGNSASEVPSFHECILWGKKYVKLAYTKEGAHSAKYPNSKGGPNKLGRQKKHQL